jgi:hypothetical protein
MKIGKKKRPSCTKHSECGQQEYYPDQAVDDRIGSFESGHQCVVDVFCSWSRLLTNWRFHPSDRAEGDGNRYNESQNAEARQIREIKTR